MANRAIASSHRRVIVEYDNGYWSVQFADDWQPFPEEYRHQRLGHLSSLGEAIRAIRGLIDDEAWPSTADKRLTARVIRVDLVYTNHAYGAAKRAKSHVGSIWQEKTR